MRPAIVLLMLLLMSLPARSAEKTYQRGTLADVQTEPVPLKYYPRHVVYTVIVASDEFRYTGTVDSSGTWVGDAHITDWIVNDSIRVPRHGEEPVPAPS